MIPMERRKEEEEKRENNPGARDCLQMRTEEQMKIHFQNKGHSMQRTCTRSPEDAASKCIFEQLLHMHYEVRHDLRPSSASSAADKTCLAIHAESR